MARSHYNYNLVQHRAVNMGLMSQTLKGIPVTLNLVPRQDTIDDRNINTRFTLTKTQFIDYERLWIFLIFLTEVSMECAANVCVTHLVSPPDHVRYRITLIA